MTLVAKLIKHVRQGDALRSAARYVNFKARHVFASRLRRDWRGFPLVQKGFISFWWHTSQQCTWRKRRELVLRSLELDNHVLCRDPDLLNLVFELQCEPGFNRVLMSLREMCNIYLWTKRTEAVHGDLAEVGVYRGGSAKLICEAKGHKRLHLFDTFAGLPEPDNGIDVLAEGEMKDTSLEKVGQSLAQYPEVYFHQGVFPQTAANVEKVAFSLVHLDMDLYQGTKDALVFFYQRLSSRGAILVHDYNSIDTPGVKKAVDEFFRGKPEPVIELWDSHCVIVKHGVTCD